MIQVHGVSKTFLIPHEKKMTLREHVLGALVGRPMGFEPLRALRNVAFEVNKGEFFSVIGKNGSGKSTLLKIIAGIYAPDRGGVRLGGTLSPFLELGIAFNPDLTARENIFLSGAVMGLRRGEIEELYDDIIGFSELERFQDQALKNFSSGMKVRLAFSVAFTVNADILLVDEVLAVGDASFQQKCYDVFRRLKGEGKTIVFVSHGMADVKQFSDRALLLHEGEIVSIGDPDKVIHDYQLLTAHEDEKRLALEEQTRTGRAKKEFTPPTDEHRWGSGKARITGVSCCDGAGREKHVFATGEQMRVRIGFEAKAPDLASLKMRLSIRRSDGVIVMETTSERIALGDLGGRAAGAVELVFPSIQLLAATYHLDVGLFPDDEEHEPADFIKDSSSIRVYQDSDSVYHALGGISYLVHEWSTTAKS